MSMNFEEAIKPSCKECRFAVYLHDEIFECHRNAPVPHYTNCTPPPVIWPFVCPNDWCGEFLRVIESEQS